MRGKLKPIENESVCAGTTILIEKPFTYILSLKEKGLRCDYCLKKGKVLKCSVCQFVHYCDRSCQKDAWNDHKWECPAIKKIFPRVLPDSARMMARIINRLNKGNGHTVRGYYSPKSFRMWKDLMSHYSDLKMDVKRMEHFTSLCGVLCEYLGNTMIPNTAELMGIYGRMCINSFTILDGEMLSIGTGIYLGASIMDHSCEPNAVATFDGPVITVRTTKDLAPLNWAQIRISYIDLLKTPYERQCELKKTYYFLCQCEKCLAEDQLVLLHAAKCPGSGCDQPLTIAWKNDLKLVIKRNAEDIDLELEFQKVYQPEVTNELSNEIIKCPKCDTEVQNDFIMKYRSAMDFTELHLQNMKNSSTSYLDVCRYCLSKQEGLLHPLNVMRAETLDLAFEANIEIGNWKEACLCAEQLIPCFKYYYGKNHPLLGILYLKYGKILLYKQNTLDALKYLKLSSEILIITHGKKSSLYRDSLIPLLQQAFIESEFK